MRAAGRRASGVLALLLAAQAALLLTGPAEARAAGEAGGTGWSAWRSSPVDPAARLAGVTPTSQAATAVLQVQPALEQQTWLGTGAALTDASAGILTANPDAANLLFAPDRTDGAHLNLVRLPLSATDFSTSGWVFGWDDGARSLNAPAQATTSVNYLTGTLLGLRPDLQVTAVPWTAPAGMKSSGVLNGGALKDASVAAYGRMLVAQAAWLASEGVPLHSMTLGNEPYHSSSTYPTMTMTDAQQIALAGQVSPALGQRGVQLWSVDHNWEHRAHYDAVHAGAPGAFAAAAFHCYGGSPGQMTGTSVPAVVTECTGTDDGYPGTFRWDARNLVVDAIAAGSTGLMMWNLALDENHGPHTGGCGTCRGVIDVHSQTGAVTRGPEFYTLAHLSRAADPGAKVISTGWNSGMPYAAFNNPDGTVGIFGHNDTGTEQVVSVQGAASPVNFRVAAGDLFTLRSGLEEEPQDTSAPTVTMNALPTFSWHGVIPLAWSAQDGGSGVAGTDVDVRSAPWNGDFGTLRPVVRGATGTTASEVGTLGSTSCFSGRSFDVAGNYSGWTTERCTATPADDAVAARTGTWTRKYSSAFYRGSALVTSATGAKLTLSRVRAKRVALVVSSGVGNGRIEAYWQGVRVGSWSLASTTSVHRKLISVRSGSTVATGTLVVKVVSSGKPVRIDGFAISQR